MAVSSKINIFPSNEPIGTITTRWNRQITQVMPKAFIDDMIAYNDQYCSNTSLPLITANNPDCYFLQSATNLRTAIGFDGTNWSLFNQFGAISQRSLTGASIINNIQNFGNDSRALTLQTNVFQNYSSNFSNGKTVILNQYNRRAYYYTENHTTYTLVKAPISSGNYVELSMPFVSGNVYSFLDLSRSIRIWTENHINFFDCSNSGTQPIHRMSNGHLYYMQSNTVRISTDNGKNYTIYSLPNFPDSNNSRHLDYNGSIYVYASQTNTIWSSTDLITWTPRTSNIPGTNANNRVYFVNALWFVFNNSSSTTSFSTSTDGITWTNRTWGGAAALIGNSVRYVNSLYMVLCNNSVQTSPTGVTWTNSIAFGNSEADVDGRSFHATSTKALFVATNGIAYFYNPSSWTTVSTTQLVTGLLNMNTPTLAGANIKVR